MRDFIRGTVVEFFDWQFRDSNREATVPESAELVVRYLECGVEKFSEVAMTEADGLWSAEWDSAAADAGTIYWNIRSASPIGLGAEGEFRLRANPANRRETD